MEDPLPLNPPYAGHIVAALPLAGGVPGKFYATDIRGRDACEPMQSREWAQSDLDFREVKGGLERLFERSGTGLLVPRVVVAFPHVSRVYSPGDPSDPRQRETNWDSALYDSRTLEYKGPCGVGCDGEIAILAQERELWRTAQSVEEYLAQLIGEGPLGEVANPNKLREFMGRT